jgi:hypothetical protein
LEDYATAPNGREDRGRPRGRRVRRANSSVRSRPGSTRHRPTGRAYWRRNGSMIAQCGQTPALLVSRSWDHLSGNRRPGAEICMSTRRSRPMRTGRPYPPRSWGFSESSFDYPPTNERWCVFQSRIKYASGRGSAKSLRALSTGSSSWSVVGSSGDQPGRGNYISNATNRAEVVTLLKEQLARFEGQAEPKEGDA